MRKRATNPYQTSFGLNLETVKLPSIDLDADIEGRRYTSESIRMGVWRARGNQNAGSDRAQVRC